CMYGFRKPFTAASYEDYTLFGMHYKVVLVIAQVIGYTVSKFLGIRIIASMQPEKRTRYILLLIAIAWAALLLFALVPAPYNFVFMFINGLPLGMVWGLVVGFIEGRRTTEIIAAVCSTSFIFASVGVKRWARALCFTASARPGCPSLPAVSLSYPCSYAPGCSTRPRHQRRKTLPSVPSGCPWAGANGGIFYGCSALP